MLWRSPSADGHRRRLATHAWTNQRPVINFWSSLNIYGSYPSGRRWVLSELLSDISRPDFSNRESLWDFSTRRLVVYHSVKSWVVQTDSVWRRANAKRVLSSNSEQSRCAFYCGILIAFMAFQWTFMSLHELSWTAWLKQLEFKVAWNFSGLPGVS